MDAGRPATLRAKTRELPRLTDVKPPTRPLARLLKSQSGYYKRAVNIVPQNVLTHYRTASRRMSVIQRTFAKT